MADDILIVDDEADIRELVSGILQDEGFITRSARDSDDALAHVASRRPNLVFLDIWLQGSRLDGLQLLDAMKTQHPELPIVMISGHGNIETAVAAIKQGAYDFIEKPFKADRLVLVAERALENSRLKREVKALQQLAPMTLVGRSPSVNQLRQTIEKVAPTNSRVPIRVPPLAERREDIADLVKYFMDQIAQATGLPHRVIGEDAMAVLQSHDWPGNVRQLRNNVERLMILAGGEPDAVITAAMLPQDVGSMVPSMPSDNGGEHLMGLPLREAREVFEREYLVAQISRFGGNISRTAEFVGMERSALPRKLKALGID